MEQSGEQRMQTYQEEFMEIDLKEVISLLWHRKWLIIGLVVVAVIASYFISKEMTPIYETSTLLMVKEESGVQDLFPEQFSLFTGKANKVDTYAEILKSRRITGRVIKEMDLQNEETGKLISSGSLQQAITVGRGKQTNLITITVTYPDPVAARDIANKLVEVFKEENQNMNRSDLRSASKFISSQVAEVRKSLSQLEQKLLNYKQEHGVFLPVEHGKELLDKLTEVETLKAEAELEMKQARLSLKEYEKYIEEEDREIISSKTISSNPIIAQNKSRLVELEIELAGLLEVYTDKHPKVVEVKKKIDEVKGVLSRTVNEIISSRTETVNPLYQSLYQNIIDLQVSIITAQSRLSSSMERITEIEKELAGLPEKELNLIRLQRETQVAENIYIMLMERKEEIQISEAMQSSDIFVVDPAVVKEDPIKPRVMLNVAIAAVLAIMIAVFIIFLKEYLDTTVKEEDDVRRLTGLPVLGVVPDIYDKKGSNGYYGGGYY